MKIAKDSTILKMMMELINTSCTCIEKNSTNHIYCFVKQVTVMLLYIVYSTIIMYTSRSIIKEGEHRQCLLYFMIIYIMDVLHNLCIANILGVE